ncbi:MAG: APC family permease [Thermoleophilaceae bacterium]|nr:APC family permease [Thermoleophilaceae bacterium]
MAFDRLRNAGREHHSDGDTRTRDADGDDTRTRDADGDHARADGDHGDAPPREHADADERTRQSGATSDAVRDARVRQRDEFGGLNWGASFFGWLVALGIAALLVSIVSAAGVATAISKVSESDARSNADTIGIAGGIVILAILVLAYYAGGYVAGRMSRFDGARQGFGVWAIGLIVTIALALAGAVLGAEYNVLDKLDLPRIPIEEGTLTGAGAITLAAIAIGSLLAALAGGKLGERYHRRVDRAAIAD